MSSTDCDPKVVEVVVININSFLFGRMWVDLSRDNPFKRLYWKSVCLAI